MNLGQSIRSGVKWLAFGKVGGRLFEFAFGIALARLLVPADFGMIATIQIFTGFVGMFVAGGMGQSLIRARQADADDFTAVFTLQLGVGLCVYGMFFAGAPLIAQFFGDPLYAELVRVSALTFLLRPLVTMRNAWLNREMDFKSRTLVDVATGFFGGVVSVALALAGLGVWSLTLSGLIGAFFNYLWLVRLTPLRLRLNFDTATMQRHAGYGARIVGNDFVDYVRVQAKVLLLSKLAGPAFLGLFNKAESLSRIPNQLLMSPTMEPLFRAMSKSQDNLDQVKYLYYRAITLLTAYTTPAYVLLWWIAEPFIAFVYGEKWAAAGAPMSVLTWVGLCLNVLLPSSVLLAVRNRLGQEMLATAINLPLLALACWIGLRWGLVGVAWGLVVAQAVHAVQLYILASRSLPTRWSDLRRALAPGWLLGALTFVALALLDRAIGPWARSAPAAYVFAMSAVGIAVAATAFLFLPLAALHSEAERWRAMLARQSRQALRRLFPSTHQRPEPDAMTTHVRPRPADQSMTPRPVRRRAKTILMLSLAGALAVLAYSARTDLAPQVRRSLAAQWRSFEHWPLPVDTITLPFDMGVADIDGDGHLDLYTTNHNYRQYLFLNGGDGGFRDVLRDWKLDQSPALPGAEQSKDLPAFAQPGAYLYWLGDTLNLRLHAIESLPPLRGTIHLFNLAGVVRNEGVNIRESVSRVGAIPETRIVFDAASSGHLVLYPSSRGTPITVRLDAPWARAQTFVGRLATVPEPFAGVLDPTARQDDSCAQCLTFEMTLLDRHGMAWADFNGDGRPDAFVNRGAIGGTLRSFPAPDRDRVRDELLLSDGPGRFVDRARESGLAKKDCSGRHVRIVDFDGDGRLDIFNNCLDRGNVGGGYPKQLYRQLADGRFEDVAERVKLDFREHEIVDLVWFDTDGDGRVDLFTHEETGYYVYRLVNGVFERNKVHTGPFHRASVKGLKGDTTDYWQFDGKLSVADFDGDGQLDVFVASKRGNVLLAGDGKGGFRPVDLDKVGLPQHSVAATWVDYDSDGRMDLHIVPEGLYRQQPDGRFARTGLLALAEAKYQAAIVNWFDRDGDGMLDVVVALQENASQWRWWERLYKRGDVRGRDDRFDWRVEAHRNLTRGPGWLQLRLVGGSGNPDAIGARVTLRSASRQQVRQVGSHDGAYLSQGHHRLYFGLGDERAPLSLDITWPDGRRQTVSGVAPNQLLTIRRDSLP